MNICIRPNTLQDLAFCAQTTTTYCRCRKRRALAHLPAPQRPGPVQQSLPGCPERSAAPGWAALHHSAAAELPARPRLGLLPTPPTQPAQGLRLRHSNANLVSILPQALDNAYACFQCSIMLATEDYVMPCLIFRSTPSLVNKPWRALEPRDQTSRTACACLGFPLHAWAHSLIM